MCMAEVMVRAQTRLAQEGGAKILERTTVEGIASGSEGVEVSAVGATYRAPDGVMAAVGRNAPPRAGPDAPLVPTLEQVSYFVPDRPLSAPHRDRPGRRAGPDAYLVPDPEHPGAFKLGFQMLGSPVDPDAGPFAPVPEREAEARAYVRAHVEDHHPTGATDTCLYTTTLEEDFVLDRCGPLVVASPCSGYGFKFAPLVGRIVADMVMGAPPPVLLERFRSDPTALRR